MTTDHPPMMAGKSATGAGTNTTGGSNRHASTTPFQTTQATISTTRRRYPSDLSDEQWRRVARIIDPQGVTAESDTSYREDESKSASETLVSETMASETTAVTRGRPRVVSMRDVLDAMNYRWRTGCTWRMLPHDFPAWATVYAYFRTWRRDGRLSEIRAVLLERETVLEKLADDRLAS